MNLKYSRQLRQLLQEAAFFIFMAMFCFAAETSAQETAQDAARFALNNPDGKKYEFVKAYVMGLEYLYQNDRAKENAGPLSEGMFEDVDALSAAMNRLITANVNLRIARNLVGKFDRTDNGLILKVAQLFAQFANDQVSHNNEERALLIQIHDAALKGQLDEPLLRLFSEQTVKINEKRKEASLKLLEASTLVGKVLISHRMNALGQLSQLGITKDERRKLLDRFKTFEGEAYRGELREGQTFLQASVSAIRQVLDDSAYASLDK